MIDANSKSPELDQDFSKENLRLIETCKMHKMVWVQTDDRGDIPPVVIVERGGKELCTVLAPQVDKNLGLQAAQILRQGFDPDNLTLLLDAHIRRVEPPEEGETLLEAAQRQRGGKSMQEMCDQEGACEIGLITDCINVVSINRDCQIQMMTLPYAYHGKDGPPFEWYPDQFSIVSEADEGVELAGYMPDSLRSIMKLPPILNSLPDLFHRQMQELMTLASHPVMRMQLPPEALQMADEMTRMKQAGEPIDFAKMFGLDQEEALLRAGRAGIAVLLQRGFSAFVGEEVMSLGPFTDPDIQVQSLSELAEQAQTVNS